MKTPAFNPYLPGYEYIPDGEPYVFDGRLYLYGSHDSFNGEDYCVNDYVCWSTPVEDLGAWRREGTIYRKTQDPLNADGTQNLFAPDVQKGLDGRYYLYYCLHRSPTVSVAVCDTPAGQFQFYGHIKHPDGTLYGHKQGDVFNFDPGVLLDDDGRLYLFTGISFTRGMMRDMVGQMYQIDGSYCVELEPDMLTIKSGPKLAAPGEEAAGGTGFEGHGFYEASSPRKINGKYYLVYSSVKSHDLCYAISDKPNEGYTYGGVIVSNGDVGLVEEAAARGYTANTHGGLVKIEGQWYIFYHRHTNCHRFSRQGCAEPVEILPDGSIPQVEMTSCGLNSGPLPARGSYEARIACNLSSADGTFEYKQAKELQHTHPHFTQSGGDREQESDQHIANLHSGGWVGFKYFRFDGGEKSLSLVVRGDAEGQMLVSTQQGGPPVARVNIQPTKEWTEFTAPLKVPSGVHPLYFQYEGEGAVRFLSFAIG